MKTTKKSITKEKEDGRIYTPQYIVNNILNLSSYNGSKILKKHVMDNSCGDGAFLCEIVKRYCEEAKKCNLSDNDISNDLSTFIHGIEIEKKEWEKCLENVNNIALSYGIENVKWDIMCKDALTVRKYDNKMDYVLGNPPYVRVHNLGNSFDEIKNFSFTQNGMTDLYIVFYEIGLKMLSPNGILGYITPSSFFNSVAGEYMRKVFVEENLLDAIVDLKHFQAFNATTYTTIAVLKKGREKKQTSYYGYDENNLIPFFIDDLSPSDYYISGKFYFAEKDDLALLQKIFFNLGKCDIEVKNGYATLCDDVFVNDFNFESNYIIPVIKSSKGIKQKIFFPYGENGKLIPEDRIKEDTNMYNYLLANKKKLVDRSNENKDGDHWYAFGRSQAINDTFKNKLAINTLLRNENDFKFINAPAGTGVYGGLYIISDTISFDEIEKALKSKEFATYISLLGKYKSGGYYTFSSKDVKKYLDYKFDYIGGFFEC